MSVSSSPFGVIYTPSGDRAFTSIGTNLGVLDTSSFKPRLLQKVSLANTTGGDEGALGLDLTHDGRYILVAQGRGAVVLDVSKLSAGEENAIVGSLIGQDGDSAIEVTVSLDDRYAFVSQEYGPNLTAAIGGIQVFDLQKAFNTGFTASAYVGYLSLGQAVVGSRLSPDGRILYVTSEIVQQTNSSQPQGGLSIIDVPTLATDPAKALLGTVYAGCQPVRIALAPAGETVWVTARASNKLLAFDAAKLLDDRENALLTSVQVGISPVGVVFVDNGRRIITADSDRFNTTDATSGLSIIDTQAALGGPEDSLGSITTGPFPREFAVSPDGNTFLVTDYDSDQVQAVDIRTLP